jgi:hypothetical protein
MISLLVQVAVGGNRHGKIAELIISNPLSSMKSQIKDQRLLSDL